MKIMVIDGNSILNRAFYGVRLLTNREGLYTNAIYGFLSTFFRLQEEEQPEHTIVCFDVKAKTFRHEKFETYKAQRKGMPEELAVQLPVLKEVLDALGIVRCELAGFEADDLIGTISRQITARGDTCTIVTGDRDSLQLVGGGTVVRLVSTKMGQAVYRHYDAQVFQDEYGFAPMQLVDLKSLMGDSSDNITGVPGVGEKTAMQLLHDFGTLEGIYQNIDDARIKKGVREKLLAGEQSAHDSYFLATIDQHVPLPIDTAQLPDEFADTQALTALFTRLEFKNYLKKFALQEEVVERTDALCVKVIAQMEQALALCKDLQQAQAVPAVIAQGRTAICLQQQQQAIVLLETDFTAEQWREIFRRLFAGNIQLVLHDAKELVVTLLADDLPADGVAFDTCLGAYLLNPTEGNYQLDRVSFSYLGIPLAPAVFEQDNAFSMLAEREQALQAMAAYTQCVGMLYSEMAEKLAQQNMQQLYYDMELPLMHVLADMQRIGCKVDAARLQEFGQELDKRIAILTSDIYAQAQEEFNINSTKMLGSILFDKLSLPAIKKTKTGYSTNAEVLESLRGYHPIVENVLEYRQLTKLKSTYVDGLLKVIDTADGRIHSHFQQTVTATGRLSSTDPNLQNIPVRTEIGRQLRHMFVAQDTQHVLIDADYSQIELRVLAHIAQDDAMTKAFCAGEDIHTATASQVFHVPLEEVTAQMRSSCKAVNFGIVYGISDFSLAQDIGVSRKEAGEYIAKYLQTYAGVKQYMDSIKASAYAQGYVETLYGRRRYLPELQSKNFNIRAFGERVAMNAPIQGTAADIIKIAMVRIWKRLQAEQYRARLILQVHDELIIEAPIEEQQAVMKLLREEMEGALSMCVPLVAEANAGYDWYDAH